MKVFPLDKLEDLIYTQGVTMLILSEQLPNTKQKQGSSLEKHINQLLLSSFCHIW